MPVFLILDSFIVTLDLRASSYNCENLSNSVESGEGDDNLVLMEAGICLMIEGGWLDFALMCNGLLSGFLKGQYFLVVRLSI